LASSAPDDLLAFLRDADRDRYLACLLTPEEKRRDLVALYAFNAEIARIRDVVREPLPGEIRLQWWRDVLSGSRDGSATGAPIAAALLATMDRHDLPPGVFEAYLDARVFDLYDDPMPDRATFEGYGGETASALIQLSIMVLDPSAAPHSADLAGHAGIAQLVAGCLLMLPVHCARGQVYVPGDILAAAGLDRDGFLAARDPDAVSRALQAFIAFGRDHLDKARAALSSAPSSVRGALLTASLAQPVFDRAEKRGAACLRESVQLAQWRRQWRLFRAAHTGSI